MVQAGHNLHQKRADICLKKMVMKSKGVRKLLPVAAFCCRSYNSGMTGTCSYFLANAVKTQQVSLR